MRRRRSRSLKPRPGYGFTMDNNKQAGIQIARAVAAIGIAYFHSWHVILSFPADSAHPIPLLKDYGFLAVNFFFAISGYVICIVATRTGFSSVDFLTRRVFRIYPLWIASSYVFLHLAKTIRGMSPQDTPFFIHYSLSLLPTKGYPFYDVGWSLQHEMAFYLLAALIVPVLGLTGLACALGLGAVLNTIVDLPWYFAQLLSYYPNFLAGMVAFAAYKHFQMLNGLFLIVLGFGMLSACIALAMPSAYPVAFCSMLLGFVSLTIKPGSILETVGTALGDASYSIYLFHALVFLVIYGHLQPPLPPVWTEEFLRFGAIAATCILALVSWRVFETPFNRLGAYVASFAVAGSKQPQLPL